MSWRILQRWFNAPPWKGAEHIQDDHGERFWIYWSDYQKDIAKLRVRYRGHPAGHVNLIEENGKLLTLADIHVSAPYRGRGVGKAMMKKIIQWAKQNGFQEIWGFISPNEEASLEYQKAWYKKQDFKVYEAKPGIFHISMNLQVDTDQEGSKDEEKER